MEYPLAALIIVYLAIALFVLTILRRFVTVHESVANAFEEAAHHLRRPLEASKATVS